MAVNMTFYSNFSKKDNSTKQPTGGTTFSVVFKDAFSIVGGTVKLQVSFDTAQNYTAAKYGNKYYKVTDVVSTTNGIVEVSLSLDVLATYKSNIANYEGLMERAPVKDEVNYLPDDTISNTGEIITNERVWSKVLLLPDDLDRDNRIVQIKTNNSESVQCYFTTYNGLKNLENQLDEAFWSSRDVELITEINFINLDIIELGLMIDPPYNTPIDYIKIGHKTYMTGSTTYAVKGPAVFRTAIYKPLSTINFTYSDARKINENYTRLSIFVNNTEVPIDSAYNNAIRVWAECLLDLNTLEALIQISVEDHDTSPLVDLKVIYSGYTNIGIPYTLSNNNAQSRKAINFTLGMAAAAASKDIPGMIAQVTNLAQNTPAYSSGTGRGTTLCLRDLVCILRLTEHGSTDYSAGEYGYPYYKVKKIASTGEMGNQTGYYRFKNPQIPLAAPEDIRNQVNSYMANGFFYE